MRVRKPSECRVWLERDGFTLVELLLVLLILATLAAIVVPKLAGRSEQARVTAAKSQIASFETALDAFEVDNGYYPEGDDGLQLLIEAPDDNEDWRGPYLGKEIPLDPWREAYIYECPGRNSLKIKDENTENAEKDVRAERRK